VGRTTDLEVRVAANLSHATLVACTEPGEDRQSMNAK